MAPALVIPGVQILSSQTILHPFPPLQLSEVTTQYYQELSHNTRTWTVRSLLIVNIMGHILESVSQSHESQRIIKSFIRQWQEFVRFKDFSVTNSSQDSHRQCRSPPLLWPSEPNMKASLMSPVSQLIVKHAEVCGKFSRPEHYNLYQPGSMVISLSLSSPTQFWMLGSLCRLIFISCQGPWSILISVDCPVSIYIF